MRRRLARLIPQTLKSALKTIYYAPLEAIDSVKGRDSMIPPRSAMFVGDGDFEKTGREFNTYLIDLGGLQPDHCVLDVGCGIGRMAIPLTAYLSSEKGRYWGIDIVKKGIEWCQSRITPRFANFHFQHSDIYNKQYNPYGKVLARDFKFPFAGGFFDLVFLTSVFTHMLPLDLENYLNEIGRVLKPGGRCFITFFILNAESRSLIRSGDSALNFKYAVEGCFTTDKEVPEFATAYDEDFVRGALKKYGLIVTAPIHYGSWCGRSEYLSYQDIVIAKKMDATTESPN